MKVLPVTKSGCGWDSPLLHGLAHLLHVVTGQLLAHVGLSWIGHIEVDPFC